MTDVRFYHLQRESTDQALPPMLEKSLERGWRVAVQTTSAERLEALDAHLWTYRDDSFLPHGTHRDPTAVLQPILLTVESHNPNAADVRFLVDGAPIPEDANLYQRVVVLFDGNDDDAVAAERDHWRAVKSHGFTATYWQTDADGRWNSRG